MTGLVEQPGPAAGAPGHLQGQGLRRGGGRRRSGGRGEPTVVPPADFTSYYGRPIVKAPTWRGDIPGYLFLGGVAAGSSLLGAGADVTGRPALRVTGRVGALLALTASFGLLVHDLGRPSRFLHMLRVAKPTSPMSMGTWLLAGYGPLVGVAAVAEALPSARRLPGLPGQLARGPLGGLLRLAGRPAGLTAAAFAPAVASYTAVLLSDTAVPSWHDAYPELPIVFVGSAAAASGGLALLATPAAQAGPARRTAVAGALVELGASVRMERRMGLTGEPFRLGWAGHLSTASRALTAAGTVGAVLSSRVGGRALAAASGAALLAGSAALRFAVFEAGVQSTRDPRYTVVPQRERIDAGRAVRGGPARVEPVTA